MNPKRRDYISITIAILDLRKSKCSVPLPLFRRGFRARFQFFHPLRRERFLEEFEMVPVKLKKRIRSNRAATDRFGLDLIQVKGFFIEIRGSIPLN
jgi:hypothetical protein